MTECLAEDLAAWSQVYEEDIAPLVDVGNPESVIGKKYEEWTPQDLMMLQGIYGPGTNTPLAKFMFKKRYEELKRLEAEVV